MCQGAWLSPRKVVQPQTMLMIMCLHMRFVDEGHLCLIWKPFGTKIAGAERKNSIYWGNPVHTRQFQKVLGHKQRLLHGFWDTSNYCVDFATRTANTMLGMQPNSWERTLDKTPKRASWGAILEKEAYVRAQLRTLLIILLLQAWQKHFSKHHHKHETAHTKPKQWLLHLSEPKAPPHDAPWTGMWPKGGITAMLHLF